MTYAYARRHEPTTGEVAFNEATGQWPGASSPALESVLFALRTQLGSALCAPGIGVDWAKLDKVTPNAEALAEQLITAGLRRYVTSGAIADLKVTARIDAANRLLYAVVFKDVRLGTVFGPINGVV